MHVLYYVWKQIIAGDLVGRHCEREQYMDEPTASKGLRGIVAAVLTAATLLAGGLVGAETAMAAPLFGATDGKITINNTAPGHTYKLLLLAKFQSATPTSASSNDLIRIDITTYPTPAVENAAKAAISEVTGTNFTDNDPLKWVASHWLGHADGMVPDSTDQGSSNESDMYSGKLRQFISVLQHKQLEGSLGFGDCDHTAGPGSACRTTTSAPYVISNLEPGLYLITDVTTTNDITSRNTDNNDAKNGNRPETLSLPMLVPTEINSYPTFRGKPYGVVNAKSKTPAINERLVSVNGGAVPSGFRAPTAGQVLGIRLTTRVPMTTEFDHFTFYAADTLTGGFRYINNGQYATKVNIGGTNINSVGTSDANDVQIDYKTTNQAGAKRVGFNFKNIRNYNASSTDGKWASGDGVITIDLYVRVVSSPIGHLTSACDLYYSNNTALQPAVDGDLSGIEALQGGQSITNMSGATASVGYAKGTALGIGANSDNTIIDFDGVSAMNVTLNNVLREGNTITNQKIGGAKYTFKGTSASGESNPWFQKLGEGNYVLVAADGASAPHECPDAVQELVVSTAQKPGANDMPLGQLKVDGLTFDTYDVKMTATAPGVKPFKPEFKITVDHGYSPIIANFSNSGDLYGLVQANTIRKSPNTDESVSGIIDVACIKDISSLPKTGTAIFLFLAVIMLLIISSIAAAITKRRHAMTR
jgi:LPXTG-motif cell wall-anchored protein